MKKYAAILSALTLAFLIVDAAGDAAVAQGRANRGPQRKRLLAWAGSNGFVEQTSPTRIRLTDAGIKAGRRLVRNHRLWELYLIQYADIAAAHVDHTADLIEHVVDAETVAELEQILERREEVPASPHVIGVRS